MKVSKSLILAVLTILPSSYGFAVLPSVHYPAAPKSCLASSATATLVDWEFTCAVDEDIDIFSELLDRKRKFDRNLTGEAFNKGMAPKQGETLSTLYPGFPQSKIMFIGEQNSAPNEYVGFATYGTKYEGFGRPYFWLEDIFIDPERRSGGAGTKMMERLAAEADKLGCTHMWWIVDQGNLRGINFYEKLGAKIDERDIYTNMDRMKWVPSSLQ